MFKKIKNIFGGCFGRAEAEDLRPLFEVMRWTFESTNQFFHQLHKEGIWIPRQRAKAIIKFGFDSADTCSSFEGNPFTSFFPQRVSIVKK